MVTRITEDYIELAAYLVELEPEDAYSEPDMLEAGLEDKYGISMENFQLLMDAIMPLTPTMLTALKGTPVHVLGVRGKGDIFTALAKIPAH